MAKMSKKSPTQRAAVKMQAKSMKAGTAPGKAGAKKLSKRVRAAID
jgi:hypothetical protein